MSFIPKIWARFTSLFALTDLFEVGFDSPESL
jgi:hypothetical protein